MSTTVFSVKKGGVQTQTVQAAIKIWRLNYRQFRNASDMIMFRAKKKTFLFMYVPNH